jgi:calmodulin
MKAVGYTPTESDMIDLMREMDIDNSGTIDFYEFVHMISHRMRPNETHENIRQAFALFDHNRDDRITFDELRVTVDKYLKRSIRDIDLEQMIELTDRHDNGSVSFDDFLHAAVCQTDRKQTNMNN